MVERSGFVCLNCETQVTPGSYRATCPECGGGLRTRRRLGG